MAQSIKEHYRDEHGLPVLDSLVREPAARLPHATSRTPIMGISCCLTDGVPDRPHRWAWVTSTSGVLRGTAAPC
jgi:hypothetical protein